MWLLSFVERGGLISPVVLSACFPMDKIQVIGTDEQLNVFNEAMQNGAKIDWEVYEKSEMALKQFIIDSDSVFSGQKRFVNRVSATNIIV